MKWELKRKVMRARVVNCSGWGWRWRKCISSRRVLPLSLISLRFGGIWNLSCKVNQKLFFPLPLPFFFPCLRQGFSSCQRTTLNSFKFDNFIFSIFLLLLAQAIWVLSAALWEDLISERDTRLRWNKVDNVVMSWEGFRGKRSWKCWTIFGIIIIKKIRRGNNKDLWILDVCVMVVIRFKHIMKIQRNQDGLTTYPWNEA